MPTTSQAFSAGSAEFPKVVSHSDAAEAVVEAQGLGIELNDDHELAATLEEFGLDGIIGTER